MRTPDSLVHKAPFPALANPRVSSAGLRMSGPARRLQALDHQTWIAARRATPPPRCLTLSFCQGSTPILVLQPKKRLAFDSGAEARQRTFSEPERFSNPDKLGECEVLDSGVEGRLSLCAGIKPACCWECKSPTRKEKANPSWPRVLRTASRGVGRSVDRGIGGPGY